MAVSGSGGWQPSNRLRLVDGQLVKVGGYTQNKPRSVVEQDPEVAAYRLWAGEAVMVDMRAPYMDCVREILEILREDLRDLE